MSNTQRLSRTDRKLGHFWSWCSCKLFEQAEMQHKEFNQDWNHSPSWQELSDMIWMRYFIECQGYSINKWVIIQNNMSALSLEYNGRVSSSKHTKHIKAKHFLIKDQEIDLWYCPTGEMWVDVLTKPLQGQLFRDMWAFLENCSRDYDYGLERQDDELVHQLTKQQVTTVTSLRECVDEQSQNSRHKVRPRRDGSPTYVYPVPPYRVSGKEAWCDTQELLQSENMDRQRALMSSHYGENELVRSQP